MPAMHNPDALHSLKTDETDFAGRPVRALRMHNDIALRLDDLLRLLARGEMRDEAMLSYLAHASLSLHSPQPPFAALVHAVIPHDAVLQSQPDAVSILAHTPAAEKRLQACFGDEIVFVPHQPSHLQIAKAVHLALQASPGARGLALMDGSLVTWGATTEAADARHIALAAQAEAFVGRQTTGDEQSLSAVHRPSQSDRDLAVQITSILRGLLSKNRRVVLRHDNSPEVLAFLARPDAQTLLHRAALFLPSLWEGAGVGNDAANDEIRAHLAHHLAGASPRIIVMPGVGLWAAGADLSEATRSASAARRAFRISAAAQALGGYVEGEEPLWPAANAAPAEGELARRIALVTGAAHGIGRAIALRLAAEGAHVVVTDIDLASAQAVAGEIVAAHGAGRAMALALDVTSEAQVQQVFDETVQAFGGLDVLVSNAGIAKVAAIADLSIKDWNLSLAINTTGHFLVSRAAMRLMGAQGIGGSLVFNATKNVTAPGKDFGAYSVAKAGEAQLCRILAIEGGPAGIRANMVNPDAVLSSNLWSPEIREKRARSQGIPVDQLEDFYMQRNLLKTKITGEDVAEAVFWLASDRAAKTTGAMIPVDGGVREAFPR
jgi:NAD(P)-dependent dehydrogenase (short-subunit alcohol dehydrogenase family)/rhamnose utilization protein RhaD (predicted bifunctional aldolase and dehydrogenase)